MKPNWENKKERIMMNGQKEKYEKDELSKKVLLATKDAKLVHLMLRRGKGSVLVNFNDTMEIRQSMTETTGFRKIPLFEEKKAEDDINIESFDDDLDNDDIFDKDVSFKPQSFKPQSFNKDEIKLEFSDSDSIDYERR